MRVRTFLSFFAMFILGSHLACDQGEGDRCEINKDCADDMICCIPAGTLEGTCQYEENCSEQ